MKKDNVLVNTNIYIYKRCLIFLDNERAEGSIIVLQIYNCIFIFVRLQFRIPLKSAINHKFNHELLRCCLLKSQQIF